MIARLQKVVRRRALLQALVVRDVRTRYIGTLLGAAWILIRPAILIAFYTFIFSVVFKMRTGTDVMGRAVGDAGPYTYALFILGGLVPWLAFSEGLNQAAASIVQNKEIITKVVFPVELLPMASVASAQVAFAAMTLIVIVLVIATGGLSVTMLWLPVFFLLITLFALGLGYIFAVVNTYFRDVSNLLPFVMLLWMYASPILYPITALPKAFQPIMRLNPMAAIVEAYRASVVFGVPPSLSSLGYAAVASVLTFMVGFALFGRAQRLFSEVL